MYTKKQWAILIISTLGYFALEKYAEWERGGYAAFGGEHLYLLFVFGMWIYYLIKNKVKKC